MLYRENQVKESCYNSNELLFKKIIQSNSYLKEISYLH